MHAWSTRLPHTTADDVPENVQAEDRVQVRINPAADAINRRGGCTTLRKEVVDSSHFKRPSLEDKSNRVILACEWGVAPSPPRRDCSTSFISKPPAGLSLALDAVSLREARMDGIKP